MTNLTLTMTQAYARKQRAWQKWQSWRKSIIKAFFPDTGGSEHLMHNWYRCSSNPKHAKLADWIFETTWGRWRKIDHQISRHNERREHMRHNRQFRPLWCPFCNPKQ